MRHVHTAINILGGQAALAESVGVSQAAISKWATGKALISAENAKAIELATNGAVSRHDLRPDIFDPPLAMESA